MDRQFRRRARFSAFLGLAVGIVLVVTGCSCSRRGDHMESESNRPDIDSPWMVRVGTRGGFTGGSSGHVIHSDGLVSSFSRITPDDSVETQALGRATPETLRALIEALNATDMQALKQHETGNMTAFLEWSQGGTVHDYTWPERMRSTPLPPPLKRAYDAAMAAVNSARP